MMRRAETAAAIFILILFTLCGAAYASAGLLSEPRFFGNVSIEGVPMEGKTPAEARSMFSGMERLSGTLLECTVDGTAYSVSAEDIGARRNVLETVQAAWDLGHEGGIFVRLSEILRLRSRPCDFTFRTVWNESLLESAAQKISTETAVPARDASLQFQPFYDPPFAFVPEAEGRRVDPSELCARMKAGIDGSAQSTFSLRGSPVAPDTTEAELRAQTRRIGSYTAALLPNPALACDAALAGSAVNGALLLPGGEFSFNSRTGERTREKGYSGSCAEPAGETGGGVDQAATAVYNAALLAGLAVEERHPHALMPSYADAGRDAAVGPGRDLRLRNASSTPVYLVFRFDESRQNITASFYGTPPAGTVSILSEGYRVVMPPKPEETTNAGEPIGWRLTLTEARPGCSVSIYRLYTNGSEIKKELVSVDAYAPRRGKTEIGTKPPKGKAK